MRSAKKKKGDVYLIMCIVQERRWTAFLSASFFKGKDSCTFIERRRVRNTSLNPRFATLGKSLITRYFCSCYSKYAVQFISRNSAFCQMCLANSSLDLNQNLYLTLMRRRSTIKLDEQKRGIFHHQHCTCSDYDFQPSFFLV